MSSVAKGFSCFVKPPVATCVNFDPDLVHGGVWKLFGDVETLRLEDTRLARSVDGGSISIPSVVSKAEVMVEFPLIFAVLIKMLVTLLS